MANVSHRDKKFVYHLTALGNLPNISRHGLLCRDDLLARGLLTVDVADPEILDGRGDLAKMVPFHFMPRNPFDYGVVRNDEHRAKRFVYLAVYRSYARVNKWKIIPRHPLAGGEERQILEWDEGLEAIEWDELDKKGNWDTDPRCKQACMAEALSPGPVPLKMIATYFFKADDDANEARSVLPGNAWLQVKPHMFPGDK